MGMTKSMRTILVIAFFTSVGFAIVLPSLWPYLKKTGATKWFLGLVVSLYSIGQMVASPLMGKGIGTYGFRRTLVCALGLIAAGNLLYVMDGKKWSITTGRVLAGIGAGNVAALRAYIAHATKPAERARYMNMITACQAMGFVVGPLLGSLCANVDVSMGALSFDQFTGPGWVCLATCVVALVLLFTAFDEPPRGAVGLGMRAHGSTKGESMRGVYTCMVLFWMTMTTFSVWETATTPLVQDAYGWTVKDAGWLFAGISGGSMLTFGVLHFLTGRVDNRKIVCAAFAIMAVSCACLLNWGESKVPEWRFCVFLVTLISVGYATAISTMMSVFSLVAPPHLMALLLGWITSAGSFGRIVGPLWTGLLLHYTSDGDVVFSVLLGITLCGTLLAVGSYSHLARRPTDATAGTTATNSTREALTSPLVGDGGENA